MEIKGKAAYLTIGAIALVLIAGATYLIYGPGINVPVADTPKPQQAGCASASGQMWTGVKVYKNAACSELWADVIGGRAGQVLVRFPDGSEEWKNRDVVTSMYVKGNDPAIAAQQWKEFK